VASSSPCCGAIVDTVSRQLLLLDVDNTLYPPSRGVVDRVDALINRYLVERVGIDPAEVDVIRRRLWSDYGTTLHGLMHGHGIDPEDYLGFVHAIELDDLLSRDDGLAAMLRRIPLLKIAVTNGSAAHARSVLACLGVRDLFFRVYGLERLGFVPKPYVQAYQAVLADLHTHGRDCVLVEDRAVNLRAARQLGMRTVYVADGGPPAADADVSVGSILDLEATLAELA
jgi:putative hydrolase of the HAD superfamily